jgi:hypothetical protein
VIGWEPVTRRQYAAGGRGTDGRWDEGAITDTPIYGSPQPAKGKDMELLPEGSRQSDAKRFYTYELLDTENQDDQKSADRIQIDSDWYEVQNVKRERAVIPHYKAVCLKITEAG